MAPKTPSNDPARSVYFGNGCFWHTQARPPSPGRWVGRHPTPPAIGARAQGGGKPGGVPAGAAFVMDAALRDGRGGCAQYDMFRVERDALGRKDADITSRPPARPGTPTHPQRFQL